MTFQISLLFQTSIVQFFGIEDLDMRNQFFLLKTIVTDAKQLSFFFTPTSKLPRSSIGLVSAETPWTSTKALIHSLVLHVMVQTSEENSSPPPCNPLFHKPPKKTSYSGIRVEEQVLVEQQLLYLNLFQQIHTFAFRHLLLTSNSEDTLIVLRGRQSST